jgi:hypothetical protein
MSQIGTVAIETDAGTVDAPVFQSGDSGSNVLEAWRVETDTGTGFIPLAKPSVSTFSFLRVQTGSGLRAVHDEPAAAPRSVTNQYKGRNFTTSTWTDSVGTADMSIDGVSASTLNGDKAASSDGVDDFGKANGPQDLPQNKTFGVSMVFRSNDASKSSWFGALDTSNQSRFQMTDIDVFDSSNGELRFSVRDINNNRLSLETSDSFTDSLSHLVVLNKTSNSNAEFYVDDMSSTVSANLTSTGFDNTDYSVPFDMGFFSENRGSTGSGIIRSKSLDLPFIEFNTEPYSQQDRLDLKARAPGL